MNHHWQPLSQPRYARSGWSGRLSAQPLGEQSRRNRDAIMIELMSHQWHSASDSLISGQYALTAGERGAGLLRAAPSVSNHYVIVMQS